jgi:HEAT repeat protein
VGNKYFILPFLFLLLLTGVLAWRFSSDREPMFEGRPLSYWMQGYLQNSSEPLQLSARAAMREIGTNAIPTLLRMLQKRDSPVKLKLIAFSEKQHMFKIEHVPARLVNYEAEGAFIELGPQAKSAVPELIAIYERNITEDSMATTADVLISVDPAAKGVVTALVKSLSNPNWKIRRNALISLLCIHSEPKVVVPELIKCLNDSHLEVREQAISGLGNYGADAVAAVPPLISLLTNQDFDIRLGAFLALQRIDSQTAARVRTAEFDKYMPRTWFDSPNNR